MARFASNKRAFGYSERSGFRYKLRDMRKEWNGLTVGYDEYEPKHPQLEPKTHVGDPQGLQDARPARTEPATQNLLPGNPFSLTSGSGTVTVTEPSHGRNTNDTVRFRNVQGSPGGLTASTFENGSGFSITVTGTDKYTFAAGSNATVTETSGGMTVTAGPVTITP